MKKNIRTLQKGFTLIELMIVVAIIGILATLALPAYQDYTIRARMAEAILSASKCRTNITEYYQIHKAFAADNHDKAYGCDETAPSKYVASVAVGANGVVTVKVADAIGITDTNKKDLTLSPVGDSTLGNIKSWTCGGTVEAKYRPASCR